MRSAFIAIISFLGLMLAITTLAQADDNKNPRGMDPFPNPYMIGQGEVGQDGGVYPGFGMGFPLYGGGMMDFDMLVALAFDESQPFSALDPLSGLIADVERKKKELEDKKDKEKDSTEKRRLEVRIQIYKRAIESLKKDQKVAKVDRKKQALEFLHSRLLAKTMLLTMASSEKRQLQRRLEGALERQLRVLGIKDDKKIKEAISEIEADPIVRIILDDAQGVKQLEETLEREHALQERVIRTLHHKSPEYERMKKDLQLSATLMTLTAPPELETYAITKPAVGRRR